jgi:hypothetical protein
MSEQKKSNANPLASSAHAPDLAWSQVRETVLMLSLSAGQIEAAMRDSNASVDVLTDSFTSMAGHMRLISENIDSLRENAENEGTRQSLQGATEQVSSMIHQAIIAFQFYDKLVQRLAHVSHSLSDLSGLVSDMKRLYNPNEWVELQGRIKGKYSTEEERLMFESVMNGMPVEEAIHNYMEALKSKSDDIELF